MKTKPCNQRLNKTLTALCVAGILLGLSTGSVLAVGQDKILVGPFSISKCPIGHGVFAIAMACESYDSNTRKCAVDCQVRA